MRPYERPDQFPDKLLNVGEIIANGITLKAICTKCATEFKVDLATILEVKGPDYSIINKKGGCRAFDCDGVCYFAYPIAHDAWVPLVTKLEPSQKATGTLIGSAHNHGPGMTVEEAVIAHRARRAAARNSDQKDGVPPAKKGR